MALAAWFVRGAGGRGAGHTVVLHRPPPDRRGIAADHRSCGHRGERFVLVLCPSPTKVVAREAQAEANAEAKPWNLRKGRGAHRYQALFAQGQLGAAQPRSTLGTLTTMAFWAARCGMAFGCSVVGDNSIMVRVRSISFRFDRARPCA